MLASVIASRSPRNSHHDQIRAHDTLRALAAERDKLLRLLHEAREWNWIEYDEMKGSDRGRELIEQGYVSHLTKLDKEIDAALKETGQ